MGTLVMLRIPLKCCAHRPRLSPSHGAEGMVSVLHVQNAFQALRTSIPGKLIPMWRCPCGTSGDRCVMGHRGLESFLGAQRPFQAPKTNILMKTDTCMGVSLWNPGWLCHGARALVSVLGVHNAFQALKTSNPGKHNTCVGVSMWNLRYRCVMGPAVWGVHTASLTFHHFEPHC